MNNEDEVIRNQLGSPRTLNSLKKSFTVQTNSDSMFLMYISKGNSLFQPHSSLFPLPKLKKRKERKNHANRTNFHLFIIQKTFQSLYIKCFMQ